MGGCFCLGIKQQTQRKGSRNPMNSVTGKIHCHQMGAGSAIHTASKVVEEDVFVGGTTTFLKGKIAPALTTRHPEAPATAKPSSHTSLTELPRCPSSPQT